MVFVGFILVVVCLVHVYLWKRLVRDPLRPGKWRRLGGVIAILLTVLVPATLIGTRTGFGEWLAWPGFIWLAVMFYLLVVLIVVELPRLAIALAIRSGTGKSSSRAPATGTPATLPLVAAGPPGAAAPRESKLSSGDSQDVRTPKQTDGQARDQTDGHATDQADSQAIEQEDDQAGERADGRAEDPERGVERRLLLARGAAIFAGLTAAGITGYGVRTALGPPQLDRVQIPIAKLPRSLDGTRFAVVSDIHLGPLTGSRHVPRIVDMINSLQADVACIVGDLVDGGVAELGQLAQPLAGIRAKQGAYFVTGNHEYYSGFQQWIDEVTDLGVRPLRNQRVEIGGLDLAGVNDLGGEQYGDGPDFPKALGDRDPARPVVLLAHQPVVAHQAAPYGVDLQLSGHTHGGQLAPFNLLVKLQQPVVSGFGVVDGVPVYVTNGAGFWGPPVRVGAPPQVTLVELRSP